MIIVFRGDSIVHGYKSQEEKRQGKERAKKVVRLISSPGFVPGSCQVEIYYTV